VEAGSVQRPCEEVKDRSLVALMLDTAPGHGVGSAELTPGPKTLKKQKEAAMRRVLFLAGLVCLAASPAIAQDPAKADPKHCKVEFENDQVRVLRWKTGPHEKIPMHEHPAYVSISLTDGHARYTLPDGKTREAQQKAGQVTWSAGEKHASENLSDKATELIQVELKGKPAAAKPAAKKKG